MNRKGDNFNPDEDITESDQITLTLETQPSISLPDDLLMGVATAATQIEGGDQNHNWYHWCEQGKIRDGGHCLTACDHIHRVREDVQLIGHLGCQTYRMGLEWSRIEPERGHFSEEGIALYWKELHLLHERGIRPLVTLWHFSHPQWVEESGGWTNPDTIQHFLDYVRFVVRKLGTWVTDWITVNEPNVYLYQAYIEGVWPPGHRDDTKNFLKGAAHLCLAHCEAYRLIHEMQPAACVGAAHHLRVMDPADRWPLTRIAVRLTRQFFQGMFLEAMTTGHFHRMMPAKGPGDGRYADFIGINYYSRDLISGTLDPGHLFGKRSVPEAAPVNDLGWEIYPEGLGRICFQTWKKYQIPLFITENGTCDAEDRFRMNFIHDHLRVLLDTVRQGVIIARYYHWTLMDNFEWAEGYHAKFGLYHTDFETQERILRPSGAYYRQICVERQLLPVPPINTR